MLAIVILINIFMIVRECFSYFSISMAKYHDQGNIQKEMLTWVIGISRG